MANDPTNQPRLLGIEIGGTKLQVGLGRLNGCLIDLERLRVDPALGAEGILEQIKEASSNLLRRLGVSSTDIAAIGIGFGGPVDTDRGVVIVSNQIDGWAEFPLSAWASKTLGVAQVALQNDADTAALGEAKFGAGVGYNPVLYVTIGSGIGGGLVVDGAIYRGSGRGSVEIGHLLVQEAEVDPSSWKTLEGIASGWSIAREGQTLVAEAQSLTGTDPPSPLIRLCQGRSSVVTAELVAQAAFEGDPGALEILGKARIALSRALAHAATLLAPRRIILGGGVSLIGEELWFGPIRLEVDRRAFPPFRGSFDIVPAALGEEVVVHGALALASDIAERGLRKS